MAFLAYQATITHGVESEVVTQTKHDNLIYGLADVLMQLLPTGEDVTIVYRQITAEEVTT